MAEAVVATGSAKRHRCAIESRFDRIHVRNIYSRHSTPGSESGSVSLHSSAISSTPTVSTNVSTPLNNRRVFAMAHTIQQCGSRQMTHLAQRLRVHATGQSIGHSRVELSRARGA